MQKKFWKNPKLLILGEKLFLPRQKWYNVISENIQQIQTKDVLNKSFWCQI